MEQEILNLLNDVSNTDIDKLTDDEVKEISDKLHDIRRRTNPLSSNINTTGDEELLFLYTPMSRDYMNKLIITAIIGYINRACDEWGVPDSVPVVPVYDYIKNPSLINPPNPVNDDTKVDPELLKEYEINKEQMGKRLVVKEFIEYLFQYDPDENVRSAYSPNKKDPERKIVITPASHMALYMEEKRVKGKRKIDKREIRNATNNLEYLNKSVKTKEEINKNSESDTTEEKKYIKESVYKISSKNGGFRLVKRKIKCTKSEYAEYIKKKNMIKKKLIDIDKDDFIE